MRRRSSGDDKRHADAKGPAGRREEPPGGQLTNKSSSPSSSKQTSDSRLSTSSSTSSSTGFQSFFRWFKRSEKEGKKAKKGSETSEGERQTEDVDVPKDLPLNVSGPSRNHRPHGGSSSSSSSCDSVFSTATNGFAFINPVNYNPHGHGEVAEFQINPGPETDTYRRRQSQQQRYRSSDHQNSILSLKKKYGLYGTSETLQSEITSTATPSTSAAPVQPPPPPAVLSVPPKPFSDLSLPSINHQSVQLRTPIEQSGQSVSHCDLIQNSLGSNNIAHRRTWSECSIKNSNKRMHVRGKRPAPPPPGATGSTPSSLNRPASSSTYSSLARSTLKKRPAPPPPYSSVSHEVLPVHSRSNRNSGADFLNKINETPVSNSTPEMDHIRYFVNQPPPTERSPQQPNVLTQITPVLEANPQARTSYGNLRLEPPNEEVPSSPKLSPISPRPWYKRPVSGSREPSAIPFKREVILRTVDKRRKKKDQDSGQQENGFLRSSRFALFSRNKEAKKTEVPEELKRRSGIGMPNISELDREAQQIIRNQRITLTDDVVLRQRVLISDSEDDEDESVAQPERRRRKSAKELISKFEAKTSQNPSRQTAPVQSVSQNHVSNSEPPTQAIKESPPPTTDAATEDIATTSSSSAVATVSVTKNTATPPDVIKKLEPVNTTVQQETPASSSTQSMQCKWKCPYCTLENPNWRILCEVCERIKPYEGKSSAGVIPIGVVVGGKKVNAAEKLKVDNLNLEKKVELVRRYFPENNNHPVGALNTLTKSASETSVGGNLMTSNKFNKTPLDSPKLTQVRNIPIYQHSNSDLHTHNEVVVNTVTVIQDPGLPVSPSGERKKTNLNGTPDLEEVRHARLNHFKPQISRDSTVPVMITDKDSLERERERLKEKIRAMNAKALSERYSSVTENRTQSLEDTYDTVYPKVTPKVPEAVKRTSPDRSAGAIKKCYNRPPVIEPVERSIPESTGFDSERLLVNGQLDQEDNSQQMKELADQLKSEKGREEFKATLRRTGTLAVNKIIKSLEMAIMDGQDEMAAKLAKDLAKMKVSLHVTRQKKEPEEKVETKEDPLLTKIQMIIEDDGKVTKDPVEIKINPDITIGQLKEKVKLEFNHPIKMQKFIFNDAILGDDQRTMRDYGMTANGNNPPLKLFIVGIHPESKSSDRESSPKKMNAKYYLAEADQFSDDENDAVVKEEEEGAMALPLPTNPPTGKWTCPLCTLINTPDKLTCGACSKTKPTELRIPEENKKNPIQLKKFTVFGNNNLSRPSGLSPSSPGGNNLNIKSPNTVKPKEEDPKVTQPPPPPVIVGAAVKLTEDPGFLSKALGNPNITRSRYRGVDNFNPKNFLKSSSPVRGSQIPVRSVTPRSPKVTDKNPLHMQLLRLNDNKEVVENTEGFECPICFADCQPGNGVVLRDCLHSFCRECLSATVEHSDEAEIKCPYMDTSYSCASVLQEREIRAVVTEQIYEKHLMKSIRQAENKIENAFHCKTPNCRGWCIYEDNVNMFRCPVCSLTNCLTCQAIHDGLNCKQYQDQMKSDCGTNEDARKTKEMLEAMVADGEAMNCPTCQVIVMKKWGCDWLQCSMCKTEICWVTRGPRWGPGGKGDISDGCKCGVFGKKCHAKCTYCH